MVFIRVCKTCGSFDIQTGLFTEGLIKSKAEMTLIKRWHNLNDNLDKIDIELNYKDITQSKKNELGDKRESIIYEMGEIEDIFYKIKDFNKWQIIKRVLDNILIWVGISILAISLFVIVHVLRY